MRARCSTRWRSGRRSSKGGRRRRREGCSTGSGHTRELDHEGEVWLRISKELVICGHKLARFALGQGDVETVIDTGLDQRCDFIGSNQIRNCRLEDWAVSQNVVEEDGPVAWLDPAAALGDKKRVCDLSWKQIGRKKLVDSVAVIVP